MELRKELSSAKSWSFGPSLSDNTMTTTEDDTSSYDFDDSDPWDGSPFSFRLSSPPVEPVVKVDPASETVFDESHVSQDEPCHGDLKRQNPSRLVDSVCRVLSPKGITRERFISSSSCGSNPNFASREQTILFLDYDDTLCPTSWLENNSAFENTAEAEGHSMGQDVSECTHERDGPLAQDVHGESTTSVRCDAMRRHESTVISFLSAAVAVSHVVIVTLAGESWFKKSMRLCMPRLEDELQRLNIEVVYARSVARRSAIKGALLEGLDPWERMKRAAMKKALSSFYSRHSRSSWKNCISIGDSTIEFDALQELTFTRKQFNSQGQQVPARCKTVKLLPSPDLGDLTEELVLMASCLPSLINYDGDIAHEIQEGDNEMSLSIMDMLRRDV
eukprot:TRINITY_DN30497_c0_g1_i1.p1 TRINITY_DN30497_c0_g1~~TRINITY_DN30497_c0_g1_i1.p1  ORF type:complete len:390 (+),score=49.94 TRINITY_DN30497_c0_g1_i1:154-1323(+)